jgi:hypothetical protein
MSPDAKGDLAAQSAVEISAPKIRRSVDDMFEQQNPDRRQPSNQVRVTLSGSADFFGHTGLVLRRQECRRSPTKHGSQAKKILVLA